MLALTSKLATKVKLFILLIRDIADSLKLCLIAILMESKTQRVLLDFSRLKVVKVLQLISTSKMFSKLCQKIKINLKALKSKVLSKKTKMTIQSSFHLAIHLPTTKAVFHIECHRLL